MLTKHSYIDFNNDGIGQIFAQTKEDNNSIQHYRIDRILSAMSKITGVKIILLDACRNNPFKSFVKSGEKGLALIDGIKGTIIGIGIGVVTGLAIKEMCKMKKSNNSKGETEPNIDAS